MGANIENDSYTTVYFNAWENDFEDNALTAIMGELSTLTDNSNEKDFKDVLKKGAILARNILPGLVKAFASKCLDVDDLKDYLENATKGLTDIFEKDVEEYANKKKTIIEFRKELHEFIVKTSPDKPLVFIVDELDRCRPNYAVSVLEQIKHFFAVPGIVFILSIDKEQLGNAVKGVYGNDNIDADEYLRRFIDLQYSLPMPDTARFVDYLYQYYEFGSFFNETNGAYARSVVDGLNFKETAKVLFKAKNTTLRQQQKIFSHSRVGLKSFVRSNHVIPILYFFLIFLRELYPDIYSKIKNKNVVVSDLNNIIPDIFSLKELDNYDTRALAVLETYFLFYLYEYLSKSDTYESILNDFNNSLKINSKVVEDNSVFKEIMPRIPKDNNIAETLFKKIELLQSIIV